MTNSTFPADAGTNLFLLSVLGTPTTGSGASARDLHNATAGDPGGVAGAKALGDLSHNVFLPAGEDATQLLFLDTWNSPTGAGQFFSDEQVIEGGKALFADREAVMWMPAAGFGNYRLPVASGRTVTAMGLMRAPVSDYDAAAAAFLADADSKINAARAAGIVSHEIWVPIPMPGVTPAVEVLGVDLWVDAAAMDAYYAAADYSALGAVFTGAPVTSTWTPAGSDWVEW